MGLLACPYNTAIGLPPARDLREGKEKAITFHDPVSEVTPPPPFFFLSFCLYRAASVAYGGSQARGRIGAVATGLHQSHSHTGSELRLQPTPQLTATPDR